MAVLLAGQGGAGKSTLAAQLMEDLQRAGGVVVVDTNLVRASLPYYGELDPRSENVWVTTAGDTGRVSREVQEAAIEGKRNLLIDDTLRDPDSALELARELRGAGYRVELHALAVNDQVSLERAHQRSERDAVDGAAPRTVPRAWHDESYRGAAAAVRRLEFAGAVDSVTVYNRLGDPIHDQAPTPGASAAGEALDRARQQLTDFERISLAKHWTDLAETMQRRGAPAHELEQIQLPLERAHYTLRANAGTAAAYDHDDPAGAHDSRALAARYGARLEHAFRSGDKQAVAALPELTGAWAAHAAGTRLAQQHGADTAFAAALEDRIADGLREGRALRPIAVRGAAAAAPTADVATR